MIRKIIHINEEKCNGCGACANACHEGAIQMVDGKARLMRDDFCDGLGDCLPACPTNAITFEEREADAYDDDAVKAHLAAKGPEALKKHLDAKKAHAHDNDTPAPHHGGCPGSMAPAAAPAASPGIFSARTRLPWKRRKSNRRAVCPSGRSRSSLLR